VARGAIILTGTIVPGYFSIRGASLTEVVDGGTGLQTTAGMSVKKQFFFTRKK